MDWAERVKPMLPAALYKGVSHTVGAMWQVAVQLLLRALSILSCL
jgi:hypothetical protein